MNCYNAYIADKLQVHCFINHIHNFTTSQPSLGIKHLAENLIYEQKEKKENSQSKNGRQKKREKKDRKLLIKDRKKTEKQLSQ